MNPVLQINYTLKIKTNTYENYLLSFTRRVPKPASSLKSIHNNSKKVIFPHLALPCVPNPSPSMCKNKVCMFNLIVMYLRRIFLEPRQSKDTIHCSQGWNVANNLLAFMGHSNYFTIQRPKNHKARVRWMVLKLSRTKCPIICGYLAWYRKRATLAGLRFTR